MTEKEIWLVASGDSRLSANQTCWPTQHEMEAALARAFSGFGYRIRRAHDYDAEKKHGFIDSQKYGIAVFKSIPADVPLIVAVSAWQYTHHVLAGLSTHKGQMLTIANWSGQWPGLVGLLNLNASLTKADVGYSTIWSETFDDDFFTAGLKEWLAGGRIHHNESHVKTFHKAQIPDEEHAQATDFAERFKKDKAIMGIFDEGCMGMFNAIVPDHLLHATGLFKERLSQSALYAKMRTVNDADAERVFQWLLRKGMRFKWGKDGESELVPEQVLEQCKMYIAALSIADEFGCATIGIQYQQGLRDLTVASDLAEGLLNNTDRPPVYAPDGRELYAGKALPHFNEVDECAGIDALITYRLWTEMGMPGENTLHDLRFGRRFTNDKVDDFVWVLMISGAAPPAHFSGGYEGASSERQPPMYFRLGGGTLKGVSKPGFIVWSRIYIEHQRLCCDTGIGEAVELPAEEVQNRWESTTREWPIMNAVFKGVSRNQMMSKHKSNHVHVAYATGEEQAHKACRIKAAALHALGIKVNFCGNVHLQQDETAPQVNSQTRYSENFN